MIDLILLITAQRAYKYITHERRRASWNWRGKKVDDDDFPSPGPKTDSRSALQMKNRWWRRLRIENAMKTSLFFWDERQLIELELGAAGASGPHKPAYRHKGGWWSRGLRPTGPPPEVELGAGIFVIFQKLLHINFQVVWRTLIFAQK